MKKQICHLAYYLFHENQNNKIEKPSAFHRPHFLKNIDQVHHDKNDIFDVYTVTLEKENIVNNKIEQLIKKYNFPLFSKNNLLILYENEIVKHIYTVNEKTNHYVTTIKHENSCFSIYKSFQKDINSLFCLFSENEQINSDIISNIQKSNLILSILCEEIIKCVFVIVSTQYKYFNEFYKFLDTHSFSFIKFKNNIVVPELFFYIFLKETIQPQSEVVLSYNNI